MDGKGNASDNTDRTLTGVSALTKFIGIKCPPVGAIGFIIDNIKTRRTEKRLGRLEELVQSLSRRFTRFEDNVPEMPDIDLFDEIVAKAVSDEDEDKTELYAALVQYWLEHKPVPYEVRLLSNAIRELTVDEIKSFHEFATSYQFNLRDKMPEQLQEIFSSRVTYLGLYIYPPDRVTLIGKKLVEVYQLSITTK